MKALLLGPAYPIRGGIANFNESLAIAFIKNSIETEIISFKRQYSSSAFPSKNPRTKEKAPFLLNIKSLIRSFSPFSWIKTARFIAHESPDIIIVQYWTPAIGLALGSILRMHSKKHSPKIIAIVHNIKPTKPRLGDNALIQFFTNSCHGFVCLSKLVIDDLSEYTPNPNKIFVPHPVYDIFGDKISKEEARKYLGLADDEKILLFFGIIRKNKGLELLLQSLALEKLRKQKIKLLVAGEFQEGKSDILNLVNTLKLNDNIVIADKFIPLEVVKYYFCAADLVTQPYIEAMQSGITQIAYNFERPMLVTNVGGMSDIVFHNKTGYVTEVSSEAIANAIVDYYENNREGYMSDQVGLEQYRFSWHAMVDSILQLAENLK